MTICVLPAQLPDILIFIPDILAFLLLQKSPSRFTKIIVCISFKWNLSLKTFEKVNDDIVYSS